MANGVA